MVKCVTNSGEHCLSPISTEEGVKLHLDEYCLR